MNKNITREAGDMADVVERNIQALLSRRNQEEKTKGVQDRIADANKPLCRQHDFCLHTPNRFWRLDHC